MTSIRMRCIGVRTTCDATERRCAVPDSSEALDGVSAQCKERCRGRACACIEERADDPAARVSASGPSVLSRVRSGPWTHRQRAPLPLSGGSSAGRPTSNDAMERLQRTILEECWRFLVLLLPRAQAHRATAGPRAPPGLLRLRSSPHRAAHQRQDAGQVLGPRKTRP